MTEEEEIFEPEEPLEEEPIEVPADPPKRSRTTAKEDLKQRVECDDCGRQVSLHTLKYGKHRCPAKKAAPEAVAAEEAPIAAPKSVPQKSRKASAARKRSPQALEK